MSSYYIIIIERVAFFNGPAGINTKELFCIFAKLKRYNRACVEQLLKRNFVIKKMPLRIYKMIKIYKSSVTYHL